jgi:hypothetical protein
MTTRESALGAWADKIPRVDGFTSPVQWDEKAVMELPLTEADIAHHLQRCGVLFLMGLGTVLVAIGLVALDAHILIHGKSTTGTVVEMRRGRRCFSPVAVFDVEGHRYRVQSDAATGTPYFNVGDPIPVRYLVSDPREAAVGGYWQLYLWPTIIAAVGTAIMLLAVGCGMHTLHKSKMQRAAE